MRIVRVLLGLLVRCRRGAGAAWWLGVRPAYSPRICAACRSGSSPGAWAPRSSSWRLQTLRWHLVMRPQIGLRYRQALAAQVVGTAFNAVLPARGGDLLRVEYLARRTGKSRATILGTEVVDRWLDWWGWFPVLAAVALAGGLPRWLETAFGTMALALVAWGLLMVALCRRGHEPEARVATGRRRTARFRSACSRSGRGGRSSSRSSSHPFRGSGRRSPCSSPRTPSTSA